MKSAALRLRGKKIGPRTLRPLFPQRVSGRHSAPSNRAAGPTYTYKPSGRLASRTGGRGLTAAAQYNTLHDMTGVTYSGGAGGSLAFAGFDRRGRPQQIAKDGATNTLAYNDAGQVTSEATPAGTVTRGCDSALRLAALTLNSPPSTLNQSYNYDGASRLNTVTAGGVSVT